MELLTPLKLDAAQKLKHWVRRNRTLCRAAVFHYFSSCIKKWKRSINKVVADSFVNQWTILKVLVEYLEILWLKLAKFVWCLESKIKFVLFSWAKKSRQSELLSCIYFRCCDAQNRHLKLPFLVGAVFPKTKSNNHNTLMVTGGCVLLVKSVVLVMLTNSELGQTEKRSLEGVIHQWLAMCYGFPSQSKLWYTAMKTLSEENETTASLISK